MRASSTTIAIAASGARIAWDSFGDETLPPVVLIQGMGAQLIGWHPGFCHRLADEGFHVIRFDNRDVGQSQHYPQAGYSLADFADDTAELLDALNLKSAHIAGQSMGGLIARNLYQRYPDRVRSLGLIYTPTSLRHARGQDLLEERMGRPVPGTREEFVDYYIEGEALCASKAFAQDISWLRKLGAEIWDRGWDPTGIGRQAQAALASLEAMSMMRIIRVPTVIIAGEDDLLIDSASSVELHEMIPDSTLRIFKGMGHELPEPLWNEIVKLLAENARTATGP